MKPGKESSVIFEVGEEIGMALSASDIHLSREEAKLVSRRLLMAKAPYELCMPHSALVIGALRQVSEHNGYEGMRRSASDMLRGYDSAEVPDQN